MEFHYQCKLKDRTKPARHYNNKFGGEYLYHDRYICPGNENISLKEFQKLSKNKCLEIEFLKMQKLKPEIIPVVIRSLGMIKKDTQFFIDQIPGMEMEKLVFTSTAQIL